MNAPAGPASFGGPGYYPVNVNLAGQRVLVIGAGESALKVLEGLIEFGATAEVVAPNVISEIESLSLVYLDKVRIHRRSLNEEDMNSIARHDYRLVFACTGSEEDNIKVAEAANKVGVLIHDCDSPEHSSFILPSLLKRGNLKIAVATDGLSPVLARALRRRIEASLGTELDKYVLFIRWLHEKLVELESDPQLGNPSERRKLSRRLADSEEIFLALQRENFEEATHLVHMIIAEAREAASV